MSLKRVLVRNFQSLEDTEVELGVLTVLVGPNDYGKSAFFRAVRAAAESASGTDFIRWGSALARVTLEVDDHTLVWEKGAQANRYVLDGVAYEKIGRSTPGDVANLLAMSSVEFDRNLSLNLNFADQDDPPFLVPFPGGVSPSQVAKVLGDLTNLNVLYRAVGEADGQRRREESTVNIRTSDRASVEGQLSQYDDLDEQLNALTSEIVDPLRTAKSLYEKLCFFRGLRDAREALRARHTVLTEESMALGGDLSPQLIDLQRTHAQLKALVVAYDQLKRLEQSVTTQTQQAELARGDLASANAAFQELMASLDVCPLCGTELSDATRPSHTAAHV